MEARTSRRRRQLSTAIVFAAAMSLLAIATARAYVPVGADFRISNVGTDADASRDAFSSAVAYNPAADEYLVAWHGDGLATEGEFEIFGQRVSATGAQIGADFRISNVTDTGADHNAFGPAVAYNAAADEYLVVWQGDGLPTDDEFEIFGQRVSAAGAEVGGDFRISNVGTDADAARDALNPAVAYNPAADQYLVTWAGEGLADDDFEIFGQRVSATGIPIVGDFRISNATDIPVTRDAHNPAVAYNAAANEYLVSWEGDALAINDWFEIFGQRVSAAGAEIGDDFRISHVTVLGIGHDAFDPAVAYSAAANEYLVTWEGEGLATEGESEIFGQRVSAAGAEIGADFRISNVGTDADANRDAFNPAVAYNAAVDEYLVTWEGDGQATEGESEIFGQRVSAAGAEIGADFRISNMGTDADPDRDATFSAATYNATADEYLVTWAGDGLATEDELENFGRLLAIVPPAPAAPSADPVPRCKGKKATVFARTGLGRRFKGSSKRDVIVGTSGRDRIKGRGGNDIVCARGGRDTVLGGGGKDRLYGRGGKDKLKGGGGRDRLYGQRGKDRIFGQGGKDKLYGGGGKDKLKGGGGADKLFGQGGRDKLFGQGGRDVLKGGGGRDSQTQ